MNREKDQMNNDPNYTDDKRGAKADAKAAKARAKAMRPFYAKKRFIIPTALVVLVVAVSLAGGGESDEQPVAADGTTTSEANDGPMTASGNTEFPPADDVELTECATQEALGWPMAKLTITNNSPETSNYLISVNFMNTAGQKVGEGSISSSNVAPDQQALVEATGTGEPEPGFTCEVAQVERFSAE